MERYELKHYENNNGKKDRNRNYLGKILIALIIGAVIGATVTFLYLYKDINEDLTRLEDSNDSIKIEITEIENEQDSIIGSITNSVGKGESTDSSNIVFTNNYSANIQSIAKNVMPSVVGVRTVELQEVTSFFMGRNYYQEVEGIGTGVIVSDDGLILTNQHVISDNPKSITVTLMDGSEFDAEVVYSDENMDLAVISIDAQNLTYADLGDSDSINVGEVSIAIGNPLGLEYERSVTAGIISATDRSIQLDQYDMATNLIQTDAAINSGNSGGPLLNASGQVIGINTYKLSTGEGMGFAIPINAAKPIVDQVKATGTFVQARIGANFIDSEIFTLLDERQKLIVGMDEAPLMSGLLLYNIDNSSDAYKKGLELYDIITKVDGESVDTLLEFRTVLHSHLPGDSIDLTVVRDGEVLEFEVELH